MFRVYCRKLTAAHGLEVACDSWGTLVKQPCKVPDCRNLPPDKAKERAELVATTDVCGISPTCILNSARGYFVQGDAPWGRRMSMDWKRHGVKIVHAGELDSNTPQTPGMTRAAAITYARSGANKLWAGTVVVQPHAKTGPHHHGELETVIYVVRGRARMRWGDRLEFCDEAEPGDFIYVPPYVPHQEINARPDMPCEAVIVRSGQEPVVVNLDIESPEPLSESNDERPFHPSR